MNDSIILKAERVFADKRIEAKPLQNFGLWVVSSNGDIVSLDDDNGHYHIYSYQVFDQDWIIHMKEKTWFTDEDEINLKKAILLARQVCAMEQ